MEYFEIECAKQHGGWAVWSTLSAATRGKLLAHEMHKNLRTHYESDVLRESSGQKTEGGARKSDAGTPWSAARETFFGGGRNVA